MTRIIDVSLLRTLGQYLVERDRSTGVDLIIVRIKGGKHANADAPRVGNGDVLVGFSRRCTHMSCYLLPAPRSGPGQLPTDDGLLNCKCHLSSFDLSNSGLPVIGPATDCLPQMALRSIDATHIELLDWIQVESVPYGVPYGGTSAKPNGI